MEKLYIVIPAYNEEENIKQVIDDWYPVVEKYNGNGESRLVIMDDGSKDSTYAIMQEYAKDRPLFHPITKPNGGHGATVLYGYNYALENNADYIFQTDSDGQTLPAEFPAFWEKRRQYDAIIGNRRTRDGDQLALTLRKLGTVTGKHSIIALRQAANKIMCIGKFCCINALFICSIQSAVTDIIHHSAGEQMSILQNNAQTAA